MKNKNNGFTKNNKLLRIALIAICSIFVLFGITASLYLNKSTKHLVAPVIETVFQHTSPSDENSHGNVSSNPTASNLSKPDDDNVSTLQKVKPTSFESIDIYPNVDFAVSGLSENEIENNINKLLAEVSDDGFNAINIMSAYNGVNITGFDNAHFKTNVDMLNYISTKADSLGIYCILTVDVNELPISSLLKTEDLILLTEYLTDDSITKNVDMLILSGYEEEFTTDYFNDYLNSGVLCGYDQFVANKLSGSLQSIYDKIYETNSALYYGAKISEDKTLNIYTKPINWIENKTFDFLLIENGSSTTTGFEDNCKWWIDNCPQDSEVYFSLYNSKIGSSEKGWISPDQIVKQLMILNDIDVNGFSLNNYTSFQKDTSGSSKAVSKYIKGQISDEYVLNNLSITAPANKSFTTYESTVTIKGASDPEFPLTLNGSEMPRNELGFFSVELDLKIGKNTFAITHKGQTETYSITYKKVVIKDYTPNTKITLDGGALLSVSTTAISNSTVTATLNGTTITLNEEPILDSLGQPVSEYSLYYGSFTMPKFFDKNQDIGKIVIKVVSSQYGTETASSGNITIKKSQLENNETYEKPSGGNYVDVGNTHVAEIVSYSAETFSATDNFDYSRPTNSYLPLGTVDYCSSSTVVAGSVEMRTLRCGKRVYTTSKDETVSKVTTGIKLPDYNTIKLNNVNDSGQYTVVALDSLWKAPFSLDLKPQSYTNTSSGSNRNYTVTSETYSYVDITFYYAAVAEGSFVFSDNSIFSKAEWIKGNSDYTLRLYLKKVGGFYGWDCDYNSEGQLVFKFLNPKKITTAQNSYGYSLKGTNIVIDVGHGGNDSGASGFNKNYPESRLNLILAEKLKAELESIGANVIMTRYDQNSNPTASERAKTIKNNNIDFCISIHRNSSSSSTPSAFNSYHFNAFSSDAAKIVYNATETQNLYKETKWSGVKWHYFYLCRASYCPVVLTENGFVSNKDEYTKMLSDDFNNKCAKALTTGIVNYFVSIQ